MRLAWELRRPLMTVWCHDDLSTGDLVGRYLIRGDDAVWFGGPLTTAVRTGAICWLDEIVEARKDTTVVIQPLADERRELPIDKRGELPPAPPEFGSPAPALEERSVGHEAGADAATTQQFVRLGAMTRSLGDSGLTEGANTRLLIHAGKLIAAGLAPREFTRRGPPIRHATRLLRESDAEVQFLVVPSDGRPEDCDEYKGDYAVEDARHALIEAQAAGIDPFGITAAREARDHAAHLFGAVHYVVIADPAQLPLRVPEFYRALTT